MIGDPQPAGDDVRHGTARRSTDPKNKNVGDLLSAKGLTWGWFQGGFARLHGGRTPTSAGSAASTTSRTTSRSSTTLDPNLQHLPPASVTEIGTTTRPTTSTT